MSSMHLSLKCIRAKDDELAYGNTLSLSLHVVEENGRTQAGMIGRRTGSVLRNASSGRVCELSRCI